MDLAICFLRIDMTKDLRIDLVRRYYLHESGVPESAQAGSALG